MRNWSRIAENYGPDAPPDGALRPEPPKPGAALASIEAAFARADTIRAAHLAEVAAARAAKVRA